MTIILTISEKYFEFDVDGSKKQVTYDLDECIVDESTCKIVFPENVRQEGSEFLQNREIDWKELLKVRFRFFKVYIVLSESIIDDLFIRSAFDYSYGVLNIPKKIMAKKEFEKEELSATNLLEVKHEDSFEHIKKKYHQTRKEMYLISSKHFSITQLYEK